MKPEDLRHALALQSVPNIGDITAKKLIQYCGSPEAVFKESPKNLLKIDHIGSYTIKELHKPEAYKNADNELQFIQQHSIQALYFQQNEYPYKLKHCVDGPIVLFQKGNINWNHTPIVSIVGTRRPTVHGRQLCEDLVETLAPFNPLIVSGFAYGIDILAQKTAVKLELQTVGCLAHALHTTYPKPHEVYRSQVESNGGFVTDFWSTTAFDRKNFLRRNRIIAGLSEATIVVESAESGGSLITASMAFNYNREVFAIPGRITDSQSMGCNNLIKTKQAHLISILADVPYILNWPTTPLSKGVQKQLFVELNAKEEQLINFLKNEGKSMLDSIAIGCEFPTSKAAYLLLNLELKGVIKPLPGKAFELV